MKSSSWAVSFLLVATACSHQPVRKSHTPYSEKQNQASTSSAPMKEDLIKKAQSLYQNGDYINAMALLDSTSETSVPMNDRTEYFNLKGLVQLAQKKPVPAEASFRKALNANTQPDYRGYYQYNLATALFEANQKTESLDILNAIDIGKLDAAHQHKVLTLKEKITSKQFANVSPSPSASAHEEPATGEAHAVAAAPTGVPGETVIPPSKEVYSGGTNKYKIGLLLPLSGRYEAFGKRVQRTIELAFQNSSESKARDFELVAADSGDSTETRLEAMKKLVEEDQVIAIIGPVLSKGIEELAARAGYYQVPLISIAQVQGPVATHLFSCTISPRDQAAQIVEYAMKVKGYSKFAVLAPSNNPGEEMANAFWNEVQARNGEIKAFEMYEPDVTDFRAPVDKSVGLYYTEARAAELKELAEKRKELNIKRKTMKTAQYFSLKPIVDFDAVFIADEAKTVGQIIPTFAYRDAKGLPYLGITSWNSNQLIQRAQDQAEGATFPVAFNTLNPPKSTKAFYDLYVGTYNAYPGELDAIAFDAAMMAIKAANDSPSTRDEFRKALEGVKGVESATGEVSMTDHRCERKLSLYTVQKGKIVAFDEKAQKKR